MEGEEEGSVGSEEPYEMNMQIDIFQICRGRKTKR
jgi:hypothetical protein